MIEGWDDMTDVERREAIWGLRGRERVHMNRVRREMFEGVKDLLRESGQQPSMIKPAPKSNVVYALRSYLAAQQPRQGGTGLSLRIAALGNGWWS